jgi:hypothetical protein
MYLKTEKTENTTTKLKQIEHALSSEAEGSNKHQHFIFAPLQGRNEGSEQVYGCIQLVEIGVVTNDLYIIIIIDVCDKLHQASSARIFI